MLIANIDNLGAFGINLDLPPYELPPNAFTTILNGRPTRAGVETIFNYSLQSDFKVGPDSHSLAYHEKNGVRYWISGNNSQVYANNGGGSVVSLKSGYNANPGVGWQFVSFQGYLIYNNGVDIPQSWDGNYTANSGLALANWDANTRVKCLRSFKQFLIGMDVTISGIRYPSRIMWSHPAEPDTLPVTWNPADDTKDAGWFPLADTSGEIIDCMPLGDVNIVYKADATYGMVFTANRNVFRFYIISREFGALGQNCIASFPGGHVVITNGDIIRHDGTGKFESIVTDKIRKDIFQRITAANRNFTFLLRQPQYEEIWICIPDAAASLAQFSSYSYYPCSFAYTWNWRTGAIGSRILPRVVAGNIGYPVVGSGTVTIDGDIGTIDSAPGTFDSGAPPEEVEGYLLATVSPNENISGTEGKFLLMDIFDANIAMPSMYVERVGLSLVGRKNDGTFKVDTTINKLITGLYPKFEIKDGSNIYAEIKVGAQQQIGKPVSWEGNNYNILPMYADPADTAYFSGVASENIRYDCLVNGPFIAFAVEIFRTANTIPTLVRFSSYDIEVKPAGRTF